MATTYWQGFQEHQINIPGFDYFGHKKHPKSTLPFKEHIHQNCIEIVIVTKGTMSYIVDKKNYQIELGKALVMFPKQPHKSDGLYQNISEIYWFLINLNCKDDFLGLSKENAGKLKNAISQLNQHIIPIDNECISLVKKIFNGLMNNIDRIYITANLVTLLAKLFLGNNMSDSNDYIILHAKDYIQLNLHNQIQLDELSDKLNISLSTLKHKFKIYTGYTPRHYINYKKIEKAKEMLTNNQSVIATAMDLGFNSSDYFSTVFKKYTTMSPSQYVQTVIQQKARQE